MAIPTNLPQRSNIQGLWHLDEASGNALDVSDNGNDLTETSGTIVSAAGKIGTCRDFERGDTEYFTIADGSQSGLDITGEITICAWIKLESIGIVQGIAGKYTSNANRAYLIWINNNNRIYANLSPDNTNVSTASSTATLGTATWYHVAFTLNQTTDKIQCYIDGLANGSEVSYTTNINNSTCPFEIGKFGAPANNTFFDGLIDEVIVWNTCLTAAEVLAVKNITAYSYGGGAVGIGSPWIFMQDALDKGKKYFKKKGLFLPDDRLFKPEVVIARGI